ncbi:MAG: hypothetical protein MJ078_01425 [Clostridia bacterium]|nr:hypothetical protein [Clostridia bacterium]
MDTEEITKEREDVPESAPTEPSDGTESGEKNDVLPEVQDQTEEEPEPEDEQNREEEPGYDYEKQAREDLEEIKRLDDRYGDVTHLSQLPFALRFAALRDKGLTVEEALAAATCRLPKETGKQHLRPSGGRSFGTGDIRMTGKELAAARNLFGNLPDREIISIYRRVNGERL